MIEEIPLDHKKDNKQMKKILTHMALNPDERTILTQKLRPAYEVVYLDELPNEKRESTFSEIEIGFGNFSLEGIDSLPQMKWLQLESVGFNQYLNQTLPSDLVITNMKGLHAFTVAETVIGGILGLYRGIDAFARFKVEKKLIGVAMRPSLHTIQDASAIILGAGTIGRKIASYLTAFGAQVLIYDKFATGSSIISDEAMLEDHLTKTDILISCLPETPETINLINANRLDALPTNALFVNVGRSSVVDENHLVKKLNENTLAGAVLDVTNQEPLPKNDPLWEAPNTVLTQHTGGGSYREQLLKFDLFLDNLKKYERGEELNNKIDLKKGF